MTKTKDLQRVEYQISPEYVKDWDGVSMLRECVANALDTHTRSRIEIQKKTPKGRKGLAVITDAGPGFPKQFLMVGNGETKDGGQIGQFREGLKLAMLVAARLGRKFRLDTTGFSVHKLAIEDTALGGKGLVVYVGPGTREVGTRIEVETTQKEYDKAAALFCTAEFVGTQRKKAPITDVSKNQVWIPAGRKAEVYINGQLVQTCPNLLFSHNFTGGDVKTLQNRDRTVLDMYSLRSALARNIVLVASTPHVTRIIDAVLGKKVYEEFNGNPYFSASVWEPRFRTRLAHVFGKDPATVKIAISDRVDELNLVAEDRGYLVVKPENWGYHQILGQLFPDVSAVVKKEEIDPLVTVKLSDLTSTQRANFDQAAAVIKRGFEIVAPDRKFPGLGLFSKHIDNPSIHGLWWKGRAWLKTSLFDGGQTMPELVRRVEVGMHELGHCISRAYDRTRDFERVLGSMLASVLIRTSDVQCQTYEDRIRHLLAIQGVPFETIVDELREKGLEPSYSKSCKNFDTRHEWRPVDLFRVWDGKKESVATDKDCYYWSPGKGRHKSHLLKIHKLVTSGRVTLTVSQLGDLTDLQSFYRVEPLSSASSTKTRQAASK